MLQSPHASFTVFLLATTCFYLGDATTLYDYPTASVNTNWTNNQLLSRDSYAYQDGSKVRIILLRGAGGPCFASGFFCVNPCDGFLFSIFVVNTSSESELLDSSLSLPPVVWSANRERPVGENATLHFTQDGDLILRDADGTTVWSAGTTNRTATGISLTDSGNLILFDGKNQSVWSSFDHPTDTLLSGQSLRQDGQRLTSNSSAKNSASGLFYLSVQPQGLHAYVDSQPPQLYVRLLKFQPEVPVPATLNFSNGRFSWFNDSANVISQPASWVIQFVRLEFDGHLRVYGIGPNSIPGVTILSDYTNFVLDYCDYPNVCGPYGICSDGQCSCFGNASNGESSIFGSIAWGQVNPGCSLVNPISCQSTENFSLLAVGNLSYFNYIDDKAAAFPQTNEENCKQTCLGNCSCKAALFKRASNTSLGECYLPMELFSLKNKTLTNYTSSAYIKVQIKPNPESDPSLSRKKSFMVAILVPTLLGSVFFITILVCSIVVKRRKSRTHPEIGVEDEFDQVPGALVRFSYEELELVTEGFKRKLGHGGFGSVFEGTLSNGTEVAVKKLEGIGQGKKEFMAEVETIGSIHHISLVELIGFCAEKSHRLLVYEYMPNGSLDRWIFTKEQEAALDWQTRRKIILDIAKGLCYLHEECKHRIAHLDIKPQNILLDENLNAKLADFGLSKLIDREQSEVMTRMRGTPGYLAPEWLTSIITEKVDVYSFGVVVLEIICSRKNLDPSLPEEEAHLIALLDTLNNDVMPDILKNNGIDMQQHGEDAMKMMKLAMWCLQSDCKKRPSMSMVIKVLDGSADVEDDIGHDFFGFWTLQSPTTRHSLSSVQ